MSVRGQIRAWLELTRGSNLPTVWTNTLAGGALAAERTQPLAWGPLVGVGAALSAMYLGGMILNDVCDEEADASERPSRPIPSGRVKRTDAGLAAWTLLLAGVAGVFALRPEGGVLALLLLSAIATYNSVHRRWAGAVVVMGACRGLVYAIAALALSGRIDAPVQWMVGAVGAYTVLLSIAARTETERADRVHRRSAWLVVLVVPVIWIGMPAGHSMPALLVGVATLIWLARCAGLVTRGRVIPGVLGMLAGFCLIDALALMLAGRPNLASGAAVLFLLTALAHRPVSGT